MLIRPFFSSLIALVFAFTPLTGQSSGRRLELDLATPTLSRTVEPGTYSIRIINRLPDEQYTLQVLQEPIPIPPFGALPHSGSIFRAGDPCADEIKKLLDALDRAAFETTLRRVFADWQDSQTSASCRERGLVEFRRATTDEPDAAYSLEPQQRLRITISRSNAAGSATTWEFTFSTTPRGEWRTIYGFTFVPDRDDRYFAKQLPNDPSKFTITRERDNAEGLASQFLPSLLLVWSPTRYRHLDLVPGLTGGLGYNFDDLSVLLGGALTYNENLTVTVGAAMHPQARLLGQYRPGDTIASALTSTQLHSDRLLPNLYFGIALRLGENPFARSSEPQREGGAKPPETPENAAPNKDSTPNQDTSTDTVTSPLVPDSAASDTIALKFDVGALPETGEIEIGGRTASIRSSVDSLIVIFDASPFSEVLGHYAAVDSTESRNAPCLVVDEGTRANLPSPTDDEIERICFSQDAVTTFGNATDGQKFLATLENLRIAIPKNDHASTVYTATLVRVEKPD